MVPISSSAVLQVLMAGLRQVRICSGSWSCPRKTATLQRFFGEGMSRIALILFSFDPFRSPCETVKDASFTLNWNLSGLKLTLFSLAVPRTFSMRWSCCASPIPLTNLSSAIALSPSSLLRTGPFFLARLHCYSKTKWRPCPNVFSPGSVCIVCCFPQKPPRAFWILKYVESLTFGITSSIVLT